MPADLTLLIPTHERPAYLERSLDYYRELPSRILVGDSSAAAYNGPLPQNVTYIHYPGAEFYAKMDLFLHRSETPFSVLCADDDFITPHGMQAALAFLKENRDYASAQGRQVSYVHEERLDFGLIYHHSIGYDLNDGAAAERYLALMRHYVQQYYAVHRTATLRRAFHAIPGFENKNFGELVVCSFAAFHGKHRVLPVFYGAREQPRGGLPVKSITEILDDPAHKAEVQSYSNTLIKELMVCQTMPLDAALAVVADGILAFVKFDIAWKGGAFSTPDDARDRLIRRWKDLDPNLPVRTLAARFDEIEKQGNPAHDAAARDQLQRISQIIIKHNVRPA